VVRKIKKKAAEEMYKNSGCRLVLFNKKGEETNRNNSGMMGEA